MGVGEGLGREGVVVRVAEGVEVEVQVLGLRVEEEVRDGTVREMVMEEREGLGESESEEVKEGEGVTDIEGGVRVRDVRERVDVGGVSDQDCDEKVPEMEGLGVPLRDGVRATVTEAVRRWLWETVKEAEGLRVGVGLPDSVGGVRVWDREGLGEREREGVALPV